VSIAICGLGRAGSIHTGNCVRNPRVHIKYFVEIDTARAEEVKKQFGLKDTIVVHADDFKKVQGTNTKLNARFSYIFFCLLRLVFMFFFCYISQSHQFHTSLLNKSFKKWYS